MDSRIESRYTELCSVKSEIRCCLFILNKYALLCDHITEMGVEYGKSTIALLMGEPRTMISYDLKKQDIINDIEIWAKESGIDFKFIQGSSLRVDIEPTDLLFIDTWHIYEQLNAELQRHSDKVRKYILMYDTYTYAFKDSPHERWEGESEIQGLWPAINNLLIKGEWHIKEETTRSNGMVVLERI